MFEFQGLEQERLNSIIVQGANSQMTDKQFIEAQIRQFKNSQARKEMIDGEEYYEGRQDILNRQRTVIGDDGTPQVVENLPNNRMVDNQYAKMVDQKKNYLLGNPAAFQSENKEHDKQLNSIFDKRFNRLIKNIGENAFNSGISWLYVYYDEQGNLRFKRFKGYEIIPGWSDDEHTILEYAIRLYEVTAYEGQQEKVIEKVEVYTENGIYRFTLENDELVPDENPFSTYFATESNGQKQEWNWNRIPLIPFKYNSREIPLVRKVKSLQDGLNTIISNFQNNMEEDVRNTVLVLVNYDGENLGEFRRNLATYGAVKVKSVDGTGGDIKTLQIEVNKENYDFIIGVFKKAIIENAMGYDAKDDRLQGQPNQMNIQSMYSDIDLDANEMETEFQASLEELLWFVNVHLYNSGKGDFEDEDVDVVFKRDVLINTAEKIENIKKSVGIVSNETLRSEHPFVDDEQSEKEQIEKEEQEEQQRYNQYNSAFGGGVNAGQ